MVGDLRSPRYSMHYKIEPGVVIKTENAAKPCGQASGYLKTILTSLESVGSTFDYGCGKLRYKDAILHSTETLTLVDSEVQLSRKQMLCGKLSTIREMARRSNRLSAQNVAEFSTLSNLYDRAFCINVLSVIPLISVRRRVLKLIKEKLRLGGLCLFVVQYRNSDFTRMLSMTNARPWRDGFIIDSLRGFSFYGLISPERLENMVSKAGFEIVDQKLNEGSVYLWARKLTKPAHRTIGRTGRHSRRYGPVA
jgi:hypothetical protein